MLDFHLGVVSPGNMTSERVQAIGLTHIKVKPFVRFINLHKCTECILLVTSFVFIFMTEMRNAHKWS